MNKKHQITKLKDLITEKDFISRLILKIERILKHLILKKRNNESELIKLMLYFFILFIVRGYLITYPFFYLSIKVTYNQKKREKKKSRKI